MAVSTLKGGALWQCEIVNKGFSPADLAARLSSRGSSMSSADIVLKLRRSFGGVATTVEQLGLNVADSVSEWIDRDGAESVDRWVSLETPGFALADEWSRASTPSYLANPLAHLVQEQQLGRRGAEVGAYLKSSGSSYGDALLIARRNVAFSVVRHSYSVPFHRPVVLARTLELAQAYLLAALDESESVDNSDQERLKLDLGKVIVTLARFSTVSLKNLELARNNLGDASRKPGAQIPVLAIYLEACLNLYHLNGEQAPLAEAGKFIRSVSGDVSESDWGSWHLSVGEVWLALADCAQSNAGRDGFLKKARESLSLCDKLDLELTYEIRFKMLGAFLEYSERSALGGKTAKIRGVRFPFGLRTAKERMPESFFGAAELIIEALRPAADRGQYAYRDSLAEIHSYLARYGGLADAPEHLRKAILLRRPVRNKAALEGLRSTLAQAEDFFLLSQKQAGGDGLMDDDSSRLRLSGINVLLNEIRSESSADPLILLAREVEARGPVNSASSVGSTEILRALKSGESSSLYAIAAERALQSHDFRRKDLGGRGGAVTVEDYAGLTGQTFVFKSSPEVCLARDEERASHMGRLLVDLKLTSRFGVIEHVMTTNAPPGGITDGETNLISVRRFANGRSLRSALQEDDANVMLALENTAEFLALFHAREPVESGLPSFTQHMRQRELGRWLKQVVPESRRLPILAKWNEFVFGVQLVRRRDAHTLNWLVDADERILAVDLESHGSRPAGYELAQLTDDYPLFEAASLDSRKAIVEHYVKCLRAFGLDLPFESIWNSYLASLCSRAVALLSDSRSTEQLRMHGFQLLQRLTAEDIPVPLSDICKELVDEWRRKSGLAGFRQVPSISQGARGRISKAMSFHLRHNPAAITARGGWMFAEDLAEALRASKHKVSADQLILIAGAMGEPRFELDGREIRATYGHSTKVKIVFPVKKPPTTLFHATPVMNLAPVFEARAGLLPMARQMVHLSENMEIAIRAASRRREPVAVIKIDTAGLDGLEFAAHETWLVPKVSASNLQVMTVREVTNELQSNRI